MSHYSCLSIVLISALLAVSTSAGCAGDDDEATPLDTSFSHINEDILVPSCGFSSCHGAGQEGLTIGADATYDELVNAPSTQRPELMRVAPGDPDHSYLLIKLIGSSEMLEDTDRMPPGGALSDEQIEAIREWIASGAGRDD